MDTLRAQQIESVKELHSSYSSDMKELTQECENLRVELERSKSELVSDKCARNVRITGFFFFFFFKGGGSICVQLVLHHKHITTPDNTRTNTHKKKKTWNRN